ncbi:unnamed protein product, partial [Mesorhabditis belari]|uniref:G-protein coupled receptors family 1 profile domain-containing protein n=1 Tax=Mesorhabditis belari TaxID=2138241 RepID=A0AAF3EXR8_9BILA
MSASELEELLEKMTGQSVNKTPWCFDASSFSAHNHSQEDYRLMQEFLLSYWHFSYVFNGWVTLLLSALGFFGNSLLLLQIYSNRVFSKRLSIHLMMICIWDITFLFCCLATYSVPVLVNGSLMFYGWMAYVLYILQPLACFCISANIWHVLAISYERYRAVIDPLGHRRTQDRFRIWLIVGGISFGAALLNGISIPFEKMLHPCYMIESKERENGTETSLYLSTILLMNQEPWINIVFHLIPDLLLRAPLPPLAILWYTYKTLAKCHKRKQIGTTVVILPTNRRIETRLYLLAAKFILCNFLFLIVFGMIEWYGMGNYIKRTEPGSERDQQLVNRYWYSYYLTDASNLLLSFHAATNWLLFYNFSTFMKKHSLAASTSMTSIQKSNAITESFAKFVLTFIDGKQHQIGREILAKICWEMPIVKQKILPNYTPHNYALLATNPTVRECGEMVGDFIQISLEWFSDPTLPYSEIREICRKLGVAQFESKANFTPQQWKQMRTISISTLFMFIMKNFNSREYTKNEIELGLTKAFNFLLSETKQAALCALVEAQRKSTRPRRSASTSRSLREYPRLGQPFVTPRSDRQKLLDTNENSNETESQPL